MQDLDIMVSLDVNIKSVLILVCEQAIWHRNLTSWRGLDVNIND